MDGKWVGLVKSRNALGTTSEGSYFDGRRHGLWTYHVQINTHNQEQEVVYGHYSNGVQTGPWTFKLTNGKTIVKDF